MGYNFDRTPAFTKDYPEMEEVSILMFGQQSAQVNMLIIFPVLYPTVISHDCGFMSHVNACRCGKHFYLAI